MFEQAAAKFVLENGQKRSLDKDVFRLKGVRPWVGTAALDRIHMGSLQPWFKHRQREGVSIGTIIHGLQIVRRILNLAAGEWVDEHGLTWLQAAPKIKLQTNTSKRKPYPLSWDEQGRVFSLLPPHLADMALFAVNTGCRDGEICNWLWEWEVAVPGLNAVIFIVPDAFVSNSEERLVVVNRIALPVIESRRGLHGKCAF
jgi:integrase